MLVVRKILSGRGYTTRRIPLRKRRFMNTATGNASSLQAVSNGEDATALLAKMVANILEYRGGETIYLRGPVGSGKTAFCRNFIREMLEDAEQVVPSPTYLLQQSYDLGDRLKIQHFDLYRFDQGKQLEIMLQRAYFEQCLQRDIVLVEWSERLSQQYCHLDRLEVSFSRDLEGVTVDVNTEKKDSRLITLRGHGKMWLKVVEAMRTVLSSKQVEPYLTVIHPLKN